MKNLPMVKDVAAVGRNVEETTLMQEYTFPLEDVVRLLKHAAQAPKHFHPYFKKWDAPGLLLVGDEGVYLMSNGVPQLVAPADDKRLFAVYASGFDSHQDPDWYENKRYMFGGDDGVEFFLLEEVKADVEGQQNAGAGNFTVRFANEPAGEVASRGICGMIADDPTFFINLLLNEPRNVKAMATRNPKLIKLFSWMNFTLQISRGSAERVLAQSISMLPEDQQWLCRTALDLCYDPNVSMDQMYGLDGLEETFAREIKANPEDRLNALKRAFEGLRQEG